MLLVNFETVLHFPYLHYISVSSVRKTNLSVISWSKIPNYIFLSEGKLTELPIKFLYEKDNNQDDRRLLQRDMTSDLQEAQLHQNSSMLEKIKTLVVSTGNSCITTNSFEHLKIFLESQNNVYTVPYNTQCKCWN